MWQSKSWGIAKAVLRGKDSAIQASLKKEEKSQKHNLPLQLMKLEKEEQIKPKAGRRREIIKIRAEINDTKTKEQTNKNSRTD